jgi:DNA 3'-phosphatase
MNLNEKKILFADLDGTLIKTASGKTFAEDCTDFRIRKDVLDKIKCMDNLSFLHIVTNQGGIPQYISKKDFETKLCGIVSFIHAYMGDVEVSFDYCMSLDKDNPNRKPNTGMLQSLFDNKLRFAAKWLKDKANMLMIGDASGKEGQFSDSDKKCAENFGIDYLDVEDFLSC